MRLFVPNLTYNYRTRIAKLILAFENKYDWNSEVMNINTATAKHTTQMLTDWLCAAFVSSIDNACKCGSVY